VKWTDLGPEWRDRFQIGNEEILTVQEREREQRELAAQSAELNKERIVQAREISDIERAIVKVDRELRKMEGVIARSELREKQLRDKASDFSSSARSTSSQVLIRGRQASARQAREEANKVEARLRAMKKAFNEKEREKKQLEKALKNVGS